MNVNCPSCGQLLAVQASQAGQVVPCPHCGQSMQLPSAARVTPVDPGPVTAPPQPAAPENPFEIKVDRNRRRPSSDSPTKSSRKKTDYSGTGNPVHSMIGIQDLLEVFEDRVTISPKGALALFNKGFLTGKKEFPFASIVAIEFKETGVTGGFIKFTMPGSSSNLKVTWTEHISDKDTFVFRGTKKNVAQARNIKNYIDTAIRALNMPQAPAGTANLSDELLRLAALRQQGVLSEAEFQAAKQKLIS